MGAVQKLCSKYGTEFHFFFRIVLNEDFTNRVDNSVKVSASKLLPLSHGFKDLGHRAIISI